MKYTFFYSSSNLFHLNTKGYRSCQKSSNEHINMTRIYFVLVLSFIVQPLFSQVYTEKQSRHRFAQMTLGLDLQSSFDGSTSYIDANGNIKSINFPGTVVPRFIIGGTHFWGHADFFIGVPLYSPTVKIENQEITSIMGVETGFKYYPYRIENSKVRPYIGTSFAPFYHEQRNNNFEYKSGPEQNHTYFPLLLGLTLRSEQHLFELGLTWDYQNERGYHISRNQIETITTPPFYATLSYKFVLETTLSAERDWESGRTELVTEKLAELGKLNGFYVGAGISSAFWLTESSYNTTKRPYIEKYSTSIMPDFTIGYYFHKPDINLAFGYRSYQGSTNSYGASQALKRKSILFEATKYLFDYHGFAPFVGPSISYENLAFRESFEGNRTVDISESKMGYGLTFGWDIRPNRVQSWLLRTNLRWYPSLHLEVEPNSKVSFSNLEFNFIQLIIYPSRMR